MPLASYPFAYWKGKRNVRDAVVELAIPGQCRTLLRCWNESPLSVGVSLKKSFGAQSQEHGD